MINPMVADVCDKKIDVIKSTISIRLTTRPPIKASGRNIIHLII